MSASYAGYTFAVFYDRSIRLWTGYWLDADGDQVGAAIYSPSKDELLIELGRDCPADW